MGSGASQEGKALSNSGSSPQVFLQLPEGSRVLLRLEESANNGGNIYVEHLLGLAAAADDTPVVEALMGGL